MKNLKLKKIIMLNLVNVFIVIVSFYVILSCNKGTSFSEITTTVKNNNIIKVDDILTNQHFIDYVNALTTFSNLVYKMSNSNLKEETIQKLEILGNTTKVNKEEFLNSLKLEKKLLKDFDVNLSKMENSLEQFHVNYPIELFEDSTNKNNFIKALEMRFEKPNHIHILARSSTDCRSRCEDKASDQLFKNFYRPASLFGLAAGGLYGYVAAVTGAHIETGIKWYLCHRNCP